MADKSIHVFECNGGLAVFPRELSTRGRGTDHIRVANHTDFDVHWHVPSGVFDDNQNHDEDIKAGQPSQPHKVKTRTAKCVAYQITLLRRAGGGRRSKRLLVKITSDPIIIIDIDRRKKKAAGRRR